jgi:hypothetical protein
MNNSWFTGTHKIILDRGLEAQKVEKHCTTKKRGVILNKIEQELPAKVGFQFLFSFGQKNEKLFSLRNPCLEKMRNK